MTNKAKPVEKPKVKKAYSYGDIQKRNFKTLNLTGEWLEHIGKPERSGSWVAYGYSGNGKTSYEMQLAKMLCGHEKVHINTLEEGMRQSFKDALNRNNMASVKNRFTFQSETYDELWKRLDRKRQPKIVFIDSLQYFFRRKRLDHYFELLEYFNDTLFIFMAHSLKGGQIKGSIAEDILYHSDCKLYIKDFVCEVQTSRYGGSKPFVIYEEGAKQRQVKLLS